MKLKLIWIRRKCASDGIISNQEIWELHNFIDDVSIPIGFIQIFPNGSTCYWMLLCQKAIPGPFFGSRIDQVSRARDAVMNIVRKNIKEQPILLKDIESLI